MIAAGIARLLYFFPEQSSPIRELWERAIVAPTAADRLERIERDLDAIRKEVTL